MNDDGWAYPPQPPAWPPAPSATPPRRASRTLAVIATFAATGIIAAGIGVGGVLLVRHVQGTPASPTPTTAPSANAGAAQARALYQQAITATSSSTGFHYVAVSGGVGAQTIIGDAGVAGGRQVITVVSSYGTEQFTLLLVQNTVYFQGNIPAAEDQLGVSTATAPGVANKWVSVVQADGPYKVLQPGITSSSQSTQITLVPISATRITKAGGASATRISGRVPPLNGVPGGTGYLDVALGSDLPITYVSTVATGTAVATFTTNFSSWGTPPSVTVPAHPVAWSTLQTSAPPNGYGSGLGGNVTPTPTPGGAI